MLDLSEKSSVQLRKRGKKSQINEEVEREVRGRGGKREENVLSFE